MDKWQVCKLYILERVVFDHCALIVKTTICALRQYRFRFEIV